MQNRMLHLPSTSPSTSVTVLWQQLPLLQLTPRRTLTLLPRRRSLPTLARAQTSPSPTAAAPSRSAVDSFWRWLGEEGAFPATSSSPVAMPGAVPEGLGLVAQKDVPRNEVVVDVPKKLWINSETVAASEIGAVCGGLRPWVSVSLFLLREKGRREESSWKPYLDILPDATDSTLFW